ncbi:MAG TPA: HEAT repeat domain-containing protein, partial [Cyclobacteriaceae bacterium]|nr:HEAT repeat domain-containing protein [Cyclobacteriaceae bacterium]
MFDRLTRFLGVEKEETGPVALLLTISFFMGLFLATVAVAAQTLFLSDTSISEKYDLPKAIMYGGAFGFIATGLFNILVDRISFRYLGAFFLLLIIGATAFLEFGKNYVQDIRSLYYIGFSLILPFTFVSNLVFWGSFNRLFTLRQQKRVIGSVDGGMDIAQILAFFTIPVMLSLGVQIEYLFTIGLISLIIFLFLFIILGSKYLSKASLAPGVMDERENKKLNIFQFISYRYVMLLAGFITVSLIALRFIDYSFYNLTTVQFTPTELPVFLSLFEATVVIVGYVIGTFVSDRIQEEYGLRVSLIINPLLLIVFTGGALALGFFFGFDASIAKDKDSVVFFFLALAMCKLFVNMLRDSLDTPVFKFYYVPIEKSIKLDAQTKIEGIVTAFANILAGGLIVLINQFDFFNLLYVTLFTLPLLVAWYLITNRMYHGYRDTLQSSLQRNRSSVEGHVVREFTLNSVLEKEVNSTAEEKVIYGLKLMEKLEPALFENSLLKLSSSDLRKVKKFADEKIHELELDTRSDNEIQGLAKQAAGLAEDSDLLSISADKLMKLGKSIKQSDRILAVKLLRKQISQRTIFILLELLRDADQKVRNEAIQTARKIKRPETWPVMIDMLSSPLYSNQVTAALKEAGAPVLPVLDAAFYRSGQSDQVMLKIVQIMGHIGGEEAWQLLWKKSDYPDKRVVKQIFYSLRYTNYNAKGRERRQVMDLLDTEIGKTLWNQCAQEELTDDDHFKYLKEALREELRDNFDQISLLMSILY